MKGGFDNERLGGIRFCWCWNGSGAYLQLGGMAQVLRRAQGRQGMEGKKVIPGMNRGCPCIRECPRRDVTCHSTCEDYAKWNEKCKAEMAAYYKRSNGAYNADTYLIERNLMHKKTVDRAKKCLNNKWKGSK